MGMGLAGLAIGVVLWEIGAPPFAWALLAFACFVWPHLANLLSKYSHDRGRARFINQVSESFFVGLAPPFMHFNVLPSVLFVTLHTMARIASGSRNLWLTMAVPLLAGILCGAMLIGFHWTPDSSLRIVLACLPLLIVYTLLISLKTRALIEKTAQQNERLQTLLRVDALTGLYGRPFWQEQAAASLHQFLKSGTPASILMLDIDRFKEINDTYGHSAGDAVLRGLAGVIRSSIRTTDCAARFGGDEFIILLPGTTVEDAVTLAERIRKRVATLRLHEIPDLQLTCSVGVASLAKHHDDLGEWMQDADVALYQVKKAGRDGVATAHAPLATTDAAE